MKDSESMVLLRRRFLKESALRNRLLREYMRWEAESRWSRRPIPVRFVMKSELMKGARASGPVRSPVSVYLEDEGWVDEYY